ncbi:hypothetical protein Val02_45360 [Virgisporangium aliadipatigenens]|uniref:Fibronectin type-III domain-containing protein n=2 Tax=Virgisporangium aliadipatigenens TaxID=741659 RepID=A0A8J4DR14_9ACTN|nr:hypothetical protein Val02_45360 [Virgisporangium aliadipatigenens]
MFGAAAAPLLLLGLAAPAVAAAPPIGLPAGAWAVCPDEKAQGCIDSVTITPDGGVAAPLAAHGLYLEVTTEDEAGISIGWAVKGWNETTVPKEVRDGTVNLELRVGPYPARYTTATARDLSVTRTTTGDGNTTVHLAGRPVQIDWTTGPLLLACLTASDCGGADTMADAGGSGYAFSGNTQDLSAWGEPYLSALDGFHFGSDAQAKPPVVLMVASPVPFWSMVLGGPHLDATGNAARGSFNAWIPPRYFAQHDTNAEAALAVGFDVVAVENNQDVSLPFTARLRDDGVAIDVPHLGYSIKTVNVFNRPSTVDPEATVPDVPGNLTVQPAAGRLGAAWQPPPGDTGPEVETYRARAFDAATGGKVVSSCAVTAPATSCDLPGLEPGGSYWVTVSALNRLGEGVSVAPRVPGTPT